MGCDPKRPFDFKAHAHKSVSLLRQHFLAAAQASKKEKEKRREVQLSVEDV